MSTHPHLGIAVEYNNYSQPPFAEKGFFKYISLYGQKLNMCVTVFSPRYVRWEKNKVLGYQYDSKKHRWVRDLYSVPNLIYDRIFYKNKSHLNTVSPLLQRLVRQYDAHMLGKGLPGKWKVYTMLKNVKGLKPFLPDTRLFQAHDTDWKEVLSHYQTIFLKPTSGMHGKGVIKMSLLSKQIIAEGRSFRNKIFKKRFNTFHSCHKWLKQYINQRSFIIQPYLSLSTHDDIPFDVRILVQKNEHGEWNETGKVVRIGKRNGLTSNLHGGGTAKDADTFITAQFSKNIQQHIYEQIDQMTRVLPQALEALHAPLFELGIDIGIEPNGKVWLLEVNSKPGRRSFSLTENQQTLLKAISAPALYAHYVSQVTKGV